MTTRVVNIRRTTGLYRYIGRPSILGNPFVIGEDGDRDEVLQKFLDYFIDRLATDPEYREAVEAVKDEALGCFCAPERCHGDIIAEWLDGGGR